MEPQDIDRFFALLNAMGVMFSDELSKPRQMLYWELLQHKITMQEWEYACEQAMDRETFHKVPLPAQLMTYVEEHRTQRRQQVIDRWERDQRTLETAERLALEADPVWQAQERQRKADLRRMEEEAYQKLARTLGPDWRNVDTHHQIPGRIAGENLTYTPSADPLALRAAALEKVAQLKAQLAREQQEQEETHENR